MRPEVERSVIRTLGPEEIHADRSAHLQLPIDGLDPIVGAQPLDLLFGWAAGLRLEVSGRPGPESIPRRGVHGLARVVDSEVRVAQHLVG